MPDVTTAPLMPGRVSRLPRDRELRPVPYFVAWIDGQPDFRVIDAERYRRCIQGDRCWVCGQPLGAIRTFVIGPMCAVNRTSAEPPSHTDCAEYSARVCPFLTRPHMRRRESGLPENGVEPAGVMLRRNPGVALVWSTRHPSMFNDGNGGVLFDIGEPLSVSWWAHGREATRDEVVASIESGLPALAAVAAQDGPDAEAELERRTVTAMELVPS